MKRAPQIIRSDEAGFSLLEVLVVVSILSVAAYVALDAVDHDSSQVRYDVTETRLEKIRRAIVGDPDLTMNGAPMISGYVADVGQLPPCLEALFAATADCDTSDSTDGIAVPDYASFVADTAAGEDPQTDTTGAFVDSGTAGLDSGDFILFTSGWRGPYVTGSLANFADAWGNGASGTSYPSGSSAPFVENGWQVTADAATFTVATLGRDRATGASTGSQFENDRAMDPIDPTDWQVSLAGLRITVEVTNTSLTAETIDTCVGIIGPSRTVPSGWEIIGAERLTDTIPPSTTTSLSFTYTGAETLTPGIRTIMRYVPDPSGCATAGQTPAIDASLVSDTERRVFAPRMTLDDVTFDVSVP